MSGWAVVAAGFLGSVHCVAMCGGIVSAVSRCHRRASVALGSYHLARGLAYCSLGAVGGAMGSGIEGLGLWAGIQRASGVLMGGTLIVVALMGLRRSVGARPLIKLRRSPSRARLWVRRVFSRHLGGGRPHAGLVAGALTSLLPCGWLWSFLLVATASGTPAAGAGVMLAFWIGSLPALLGAGLLARVVGGRTLRYAPRATALILLAMGLASVFGRLPGIDVGGGEPPCH